ncbi:MAG TPA: short-chain dehydrogenase/reductase [Microscillaceae bacterium]|nr:short-chain dehydrogenase/reductase [Microscillaceae bacterium]
MSTRKTILITGTSSGIGAAAVQYFSQQGWNVAATMRTPDKDTQLRALPNVKLYALDVHDETSIQQAVADTLRDFGSLEVIVNNAGYGAIGIFEKATADQIRKQFDTNVFGAMNVIRAVLPHFREQKQGTIINVTSMGGLVTFPIYSVYHGTKWALEGFSESLHYELRQFNIKVKCIEPGAIKTDFYTRSQDFFENPSLTAYDNYQAITHENTQKAGATAPGPEVVAKAIFKAANDKSFRLRYPAGNQATWILPLRKLLPLSWFINIVRGQVEKGFKSAY